MENFLVFILVVLFIYGMYYFILRISGLTHQDAKDGLTSFTIALPLIGLAFFIFTLPTFFFVNWLEDTYSFENIYLGYFLIIFSLFLGLLFVGVTLSAILYFWNKEKYLEKLSKEDKKLSRWLYKKLTDN